MPSPVSPEISQLLIFGDSLSDTGNARALLGDRAFPCPPHWANRRCDGPLWVEALAVGLGLPTPLPSLAGGTNHAFGGARSGRGVSPKGVPNLLTQVEGLQRQATGALDGALVVLRAGANDYLDAPPSPAVGDGVNAHLLKAVGALADGGLRRFLVPDELPWGVSPIDLPGFGEPERHALNALIARQNRTLREALNHLATQRELLVVQPDAHQLLREVCARPASWGFSEVRRPVLEAGVEGVPDARGVLWWDSWGHLTSAFHELLAERALAALRCSNGSCD
ncbi:MAG: SGNH/GDSL hydrolase family protein [Cyanobium sp.]